MNSVFAAISIILAEVSLILLIISGTLIFFKLRDHRRDKATLALLTEKLKAGEEERLNVLSVKLQETQGIEGDALNAAAKEIYNKEIDFYITMMTIYAKRERNTLEEINQKVATLAESYAKLGNKPTEDSSDTNNEEANQEIITLTAENSRLQQELSTSQALNESLEKELAAVKKEGHETEAEFVSAFSGGRDAAEALIAKQKQKRNTDDSPTDALDEALEVEQAPATADDSDAQADVTGEDSNTTEPPAPEIPEDESNPFLSIDDTDESVASDNLIDLAMSDDDLEIDTSQEQDEQPSSPSQEKEDTPPAPETTAAEKLPPDDATPNDNQSSATNAEEAEVEQPLERDDIDDILAAATDDAKKSPDNTKEPTDTDIDISDDDIDAILNDIDFSPPTAAAENKKETEKTG